MSKHWFDVDKGGLGKQAEEHGKGRLIGELVQNALDEAGVSQMAVTLALVAVRPLADLAGNRRQLSDPLQCGLRAV
jgi:hypothetical protein